MCDTLYNEAYVTIDLPYRKIPELLEHPEQNMTCYYCDEQNTILNAPNFIKVIDVHCSDFDDYVPKWPTDLEYLCLPTCYNHPLNLTATNLIYLNLGKQEEYASSYDIGQFNNKLKNCLPKSLKYLEIYSSEYTESIDDLLEGLDNLETLVIRCKSTSLSTTFLKSSKSINLKNMTIRTTNSVDLNLLPDSLETLSISCPDSYYTKKVTNWPKNLKILSIGYGFRSELMNLPEFLEELKIETHFDVKITLSPNIKKINILHSEIHHDCILTLPKSVTHALFYMHYYNKKIDFPSSMKYLYYFDESYTFLEELKRENPNVIIESCEPRNIELTNDQIKYGKKLAGVVKHIWDNSSTSFYIGSVQFGSLFLLSF